MSNFEVTISSIGIDRLIDSFSLIMSAADKEDTQKCVEIIGCTITSEDGMTFYNRCMRSSDFHKFPHKMSSKTATYFAWEWLKNCHEGNSKISWIITNVALRCNSAILSVKPVRIYGR